MEQLGSVVKPRKVGPLVHACTCSTCGKEWQSDKRLTVCLHCINKFGSMGKPQFPKKPVLGADPTRPGWQEPEINSKAKKLLAQWEVERTEDRRRSKLQGLDRILDIQAHPEDYIG